MSDITCLRCGKPITDFPASFPCSEFPTEHLNQGFTALRSELAQARAELAEYKVALAETKIDIQNGVLVLADERKQYENLLAELAALRERQQERCDWIYDEYEGSWTGNCGICWILETDTPAENEMAYCPKCGKLLQAQYSPGR